MSVTKTQRRSKIRKGIRSKISGTAQKPRLSVYRSNKAIYAQLIDDINGVTLSESSSVKVDSKGKTKIEVSNLVGKVLGEKATAAGITNVVFDRGGYLYHGRVKALAEGARESGLNF